MVTSRAVGAGENRRKDARAGFAIHLLASGANLAYGGDLRDSGFTRLIFDLVLRYQPRKERVPPVANYLAWPVHATMKTENIRALDEELQGFARLVLVGLDGHTKSCESHRAVPFDAMDDGKWCAGLTAMRELMRDQTDARTLLGGKLEGYKGTMPDVAEEALLAIKAKQPVFLSVASAVVPGTSRRRWGSRTAGLGCGTHGKGASCSTAKREMT